MPKLLRPFFLHRRGLLGPLCQAAWDTAAQLIAEAAGTDLRPAWWPPCPPRRRISGGIPSCTPWHRAEALRGSEGIWEERFERVYGFWRGFVDDIVYRYSDCGLFEAGFARVYCDACKSEFLVAFSCQARGFCPSCSAKRTAIFGALLVDEILEDVPHSMWSFTVPKMLRPYFLHHRELLGKLCVAAWGTVRELMAEAADEEGGFRPGMVAVVHTAGDFLGWHPHAHAIISRGGWTRDGDWVPVPYVDMRAAELLFRHKIFAMLKKEGLLSDERIKLMLSWRHSVFRSMPSPGGSRRRNQRDRPGFDDEDSGLAPYRAWLVGI